MKNMKMILAVLSLIMVNGAFGAEKSKTTKLKETPEMRQKMAEAHESMATCLRSDKSMNECKKEMMDSYPEMMGKGGCMMMDEMRGHMSGVMKRGMMKKGMMDSGSDENSTDENKK